MPNIGVWEIVIVVVIAFLVFGPRKLPELGSSLGRSISGFKKGLKDTKDEMEAAMKEDDADPTATTTSPTSAASTPAPATTATAETEKVEATTAAATPTGASAAQTPAATDPE